MTKQTEIALLGRGIDKETSMRLISDGYTLNKLQILKKDALVELGLNNDQISKIQDKRRPPIPVKTVNTLLINSAFTCSVCRDKNNPIIIHHIEEWSKTRSHDENNLIVLCLNCHSKAHSQNSISLNLNVSRLKDYKTKWEEFVRKRGADSLFTKSNWPILGGMWDYFNHNRVVDVAGELKIDVKSVGGYEQLLQSKVISSNGSYIWPQSVPLSNKESIRYIYDGSLPGFDHSLRKFYANLVKKILEDTQSLDISHIFKKSTAQLLDSYPIITATGAFRFKNIRKNSAGPGQTIEGYKSARGLRIEFSIDAWETTSPSAHGVNLSGVWRSTCILLVRDISKSAKVTTIKCTCLSIGTGFTDFCSPTPAIAYRHELDDAYA